MNPERWEHIARLHAEALLHSGAERASFLDEATGGDDDLRGEVRSLLAEEDRSGVLDDPMLASALRSAWAAWARCIAHATPSSGARSR